ncbi:helix-turn-helix domain-containing protein [Natronorarus salvus]|uniref:helix-turn-helix domain-containing protein n=1 Tax=Natronorarus salvus TaxID=3117733 RepID=UPI002F26A203
MLIARFGLPPEALALEHTLAEHPKMEVDAERIAAHSTEWTMPCLWITADDFAAVDRTLAEDPSVDSIVDDDEFGSEKYYHVEWSEPVEERVNAYIDKEGSILNATATADGWRVTFRFATRDQFEAFRTTVVERDHAFELLELFEPGSPRTSMPRVTPAQRTALATARERGYFKVPREVSSRKLAAELDMSHQSLSELLRRGTENLIDVSLTTGRSPEER